MLSIVYDVMIIGVRVFVLSIVHDVMIIGVRVLC